MAFPVHEACLYLNPSLKAWWCPLPQATSAAHIEEVSHSKAGSLGHCGRGCVCPGALGDGSERWRSKSPGPAAAGSGCVAAGASVCPKYVDRTGSIILMLPEATSPSPSTFSFVSWGRGTPSYLYFSGFGYPTSAPKLPLPTAILKKVKRSSVL